MIIFTQDPWKKTPLIYDSTQVSEYDGGTSVGAFAEEEDGSPFDPNRIPESAWNVVCPSPMDSRPASAALLCGWLGDARTGRTLPPTRCSMDEWDWAPLELAL